MRAGLPQTVWTFWLQGWDAAPMVCRASLASWQRQNPDWQITALSGENLGDWLPPAVVADRWPGVRVVGPAVQRYPELGEFAQLEAADLLDVPADLPVHPWYLREPDATPAP